MKGLVILVKYKLTHSTTILNRNYLLVH